MLCKQDHIQYIGLLIMFNRMRNKFSLISIREDRSSLEIDGVNAVALFSDIDTVWNTSVVSKYMFKRSTRHSFKIGKFFALDLLYILETLIRTPNIRSSKRHLRKTVQLMLENTWVGDIHKERLGSITDVKLAKGIFPFQSKEYQDDYIKHYGVTVPNYRLKGYLLDAGAGTGKAQPLDARIRDLDGWSLMGDMYVGKDIVTPTGALQRVIGIYPQGEREVFVVTFQDGRSTRCCGEHLWLVEEDRNGGAIVDTHYLLRMIDHHDYYIPVVSNLEDDDKEITDYVEIEDALNGNWASRDNFAKVHFTNYVGNDFNIDYEYGIPEEFSQAQVVELFRSLGYFVEVMENHISVRFVDRLKIESIIPDGFEPVQCIMVSGDDSLYVTDDYIVTHNTATGIMLGKALLPTPDKTIIISPNNATDRVWRSTLEDLMLPDAKVFTSNLKDNELSLDFDYYVVHYEFLVKFLPYFIANRSKFKNSYLILDESHNFNDPASIRTELLIELCRSPEVANINFASATPIMALGYECIPFLKCVDPYFDKDSEERFKKIYGRNAKRGNDILRNRIGHMKYHVPKQDVVDVEVVEVDELVKLPNGLEYTLPVVQERMRAFIEERKKYYATNKEKYHKDYNDAIEFFSDTKAAIYHSDDFNTYKANVKTISAGFDPYTMSPLSKFCNRFEQRVIRPELPNDMKKKFQSAKSVVKYVDLKIMGEALGGIVGKARSACNRDIVAALELEKLINLAEKKTLIFTDHIEVLEHTNVRLKEMGFTPALVYGHTNKELPQTVKKFYNDPDVNPMIATLKSLSTAVPITCANHVVFLNQPFRDGIKEQARSRAARLGQDTRVIVTNVLLDTGNVPNLSTRANDIMQWSGEQVKSIIGTDNLDLDTLSFESMGVEDIVDPKYDYDELKEDTNDYLPVEVLPSMLFSYGILSGSFYDDAMYSRYMLLKCILPGEFTCSYDGEARLVHIKLAGTESTASISEVISHFTENEVTSVMVNPSETDEFTFVDNPAEGVSEYKLWSNDSSSSQVTDVKVRDILSDLYEA